MLKSLLRAIIILISLIAVTAEADDNLFTFTFYEFIPNTSYDASISRKEYLSDRVILKTYQEHDNITMLEKHTLRLTNTKYTEFSPLSMSQKLDLDIIEWCSNRSSAGAHISYSNSN